MDERKRQPKRVKRPGAAEAAAARAQELVVDASRGPDAPINKGIDMTYAEAMAKWPSGEIPRIDPVTGQRNHAILTEQGWIPLARPAPPPGVASSMVPVELVRDLLPK